WRGLFWKSFFIAVDDGLKIWERFSPRPLRRRAIEALSVDEGESLHYQPCPSPIWDTALAVNALVESDLPPDHVALRRAAEWMIPRQVLMPGDWQVKRPHV